MKLFKTSVTVSQDYFDIWLTQYYDSKAKKYIFGASRLDSRYTWFIS